MPKASKLIETEPTADQGLSEGKQEGATLNGTELRFGMMKKVLESGRLPNNANVLKASEGQLENG